MRFLLLPFIVFPIIELVILIEVGSVIGALPTIGLVLLTAVIGAALLRQQGLATLLRANQRMQSGEIPAREVCEGFVIAIGGALLLTPGFVTDSIGLLCLLPGSRHWLVSRMLKRAVFSGQAGFFGGGFGQGPGGGPTMGPGRRNADGNVVIDGEFDREQGPEEGRDRRSGEHLDDHSEGDKKK
jgi:UPF0716 protein FxsA